MEKLNCVPGKSREVVFEIEPSDQMARIKNVITEFISAFDCKFNRVARSIGFASRVTKRENVV